MGIPSSIETLPADILAQLQALLRDPRITQMDATIRINAILSEQGAERVSKSAVNRYAQKMDRIGAKLSQSRAIADMWIGKLGNEPAGKVGALLNEVVRNLAFESAMHMAEDEAPADPKLIKELAFAIEKLEKASSENEKRAAEIRKRVLEEAADKAADIAKRNGLTADAIATFKREMLGVPEA